MSEPFEPGKHLIQLRGKGGATDYMPVQWRLVWFREAHPDGRIDCQLVELDREAGFALFRAEITTPGGGSAVGFGSETARDFGDFIEKASTKAIGRALAALGFGTQFVGDELDEGARIVDAPAPRPQPAPSRPARQDASQMVTYKETGEHLDKQGFRYRPRIDGSAEIAARNDAPDPNSQRATERQVRFIRAVAREVGLDDAALAAWCQELYGQSVDELNRLDASALIEALQRRRNEVA